MNDSYIWRYFLNLVHFNDYVLMSSDVIKTSTADLFA